MGYQTNRFYSYKTIYTNKRVTSKVYFKIIAKSFLVKMFSLKIPKVKKIFKENLSYTILKLTEIITKR